MNITTRIKKKIQYELKKRLGIDLSTPKVYRPQLDIVVNMDTIGTWYGDWTLATDGLGTHSIVYSCGIGEDISWDIGLIEKYNVQIYGFDPTPKSIDFIKTQDLPAQFHFHQYGIANRDATILLYPPEDPDHVSHTILYKPETASQGFKAPFKRVVTIAKELGHPHIDILKLDIEGAEYDVIDDVLRSGVSVKQILVEFHHRFPNLSIWQTIRTTQKLQKHGYKVFHVSDTADELSFIRG